MPAASWRVWAYDRLRLYVPFTEIIPQESIYGSGDLEGAPAEKPFAVITFGIETVELRDADKAAATSQQMTLYLHDEPGDYMLIDSLLVLARDALVGPAGDAVNGIAAVWQGDSQDLADDQFGTIMRNADFRLVGRKG